MVLHIDAGCQEASMGGYDANMRSRRTCSTDLRRSTNSHLVRRQAQCTLTKTNLICVPQRENGKTS